MTPEKSISSSICICGNPECVIPHGCCHCGCGKTTSLWTQNHTRSGGNSNSHVKEKSYPQAQMPYTDTDD